jgi:hypothetical protein
VHVSPSSKANASGGSRPSASQSEAAKLRYELESLRSRRIVRLALMVAEFLRRPWELWRLPGLLRDALRPVPAPTRPAETRGRKSGRSGLRLDAPARRRRYPHLVVAHLGGAGPYGALAPHVRLDPQGWREQLEEGADLLLVEAATPGWPLEEVTEACAELEVSIVLRLRDAAGLAALDAGLAPDLVVTDDPRLAEQVSGRVGEDRLLRLDPATDLRRWNPVGWRREPEHAVMIVLAREPGTAQAEELGEVVESLGQEVTLCLTTEVDPGRLPPRLVTARVEQVDGPAALAEAARGHRAVLALPDLHPTPTAYARHVLDLVACGTPTIHLPDDTLRRLLPARLGLEVADTAAAGDLLATLAEPDRRERTSIAARRHVLTHHTTDHRFDALLTRLGIPTAEPPTISVLLCTTRPEFLDHAHEQIARQDHPRLEIITICHGDGFDPDHLERLNARHSHPTRTLHAPGDWPLGQALNLGLDHATGELVTKMDDDDHYGPGHLTDLLLALRYSRADVVGKLANFVYLSGDDVTIDRYLTHQESFVWHLPGATLLTHRETLAAYRFSHVRRAVDTTLYKRLHADGGRRYSTHRFNFIRYRGGQHTYARTDAEFLEQAEHTYPGLAREQTEI